jgi:hypothetical protein
LFIPFEERVASKMPHLHDRVSGSIVSLGLYGLG